MVAILILRSFLTSNSAVSHHRAQGSPLPADYDWPCIINALTRYIN